MFLFHALPAALRRRAPAPDRRRGVQWGMVFAGLFMTLLGRFALFSTPSTPFMQALAGLGVELLWGCVMLLVGGVTILAAFTPCRPALVVVYGIGGLVLCWTWILVGWIAGISGPLVDVCLGGGFVLLTAAVSTARQSVCVRAFQRAWDGHSNRRR